MRIAPSRKEKLVDTPTVPPQRANGSGPLPMIKGADAGGKIVELMDVGKRLRLGRHTYAQGGTVRMVRRNRSFGSGVSSNRARKIA